VLLFQNLYKLDSLSLDNNHIEEIDEYSFLGLANFKTFLYLNSNELQILRIKGFSSLRNLIKLFLGQNQINTIEVDAFWGLENLKELYMDSNLLEFIDNSTFKDLKSLTILELDNNEIKFIDAFSFDAMKSTLTTLDLSLNRISKVNNETFFNLSKLETLNLFDSEIIEIQSFTFGSSLKGLKNLNLSLNRLELIKVNTFVNLSSLVSLDISNNRIMKIENKAFGQNLNQLTDLCIRGNYLDKIGSENFIGIENLQSLELNFNEIKYLSRKFFENVRRLGYLYLSNNELKTIESKAFEKITNLNSLYLDYNQLSNLREQVFYNLGSLKELNLCGNKFQSIQQLKSNLQFLLKLESIDLSENQFEYLDENDFNFSRSLKNINLNGNKIKFINNGTFINVPLMEALKISKLYTDYIEFKLFSNNPKLTEIDLSHNTVIVHITDINKLLKNIRKINLKNVKFISNNISLDRFLTNKLITEINFSQNNLSHNYSMFDFLTKLDKLELRRINLDTMTFIKFGNFPQLRHLDLSFNNIYRLHEVSFRNLFNLIYLDLSNNRIETIDIGVFASTNSNGLLLKWNFLNFLSLENNRIKFIEYFSEFFCASEIIKFSNNRFGDDLSNFNNLHKLKELYLNKNKLKYLNNSDLFSNKLLRLNILNLNSNEISFMDKNLFSNLKTLVNLSIADNQLTSINKALFFNLFNLRYLNLSRNRIEFIESSSFCGLDNLLSLDLSFNRLHSIRNEIFHGLFDLSDLNLINNSQFLTFENQSLNSTLNVSNIVLDIHLIEQYKCFLMHSMKRVVRRNVSNKYIFYKSINLLTINRENDLDCELTFQFLQFRIHLNLKNDFENDRFYEKCKDFLIKDSNIFNSSLSSCFNHILVRGKEDNTPIEINLFQIFMTDYVFLLTVIALLSLFGPLSILICNHFYVTSKKISEPLLLNNKSKIKSRIVLLKAVSKFVFIFEKSTSNAIDHSILDKIEKN
jgi:insulin-like growth factor-binding protein complex acid labile subunit